MLVFFFFNDTATTEIYTLSLHDALPICDSGGVDCDYRGRILPDGPWYERVRGSTPGSAACSRGDRKSTRLNSSHSQISYAVFCLKKKTCHLDASKCGQRFIESCFSSCAA